MLAIRKKMFVVIFAAALCAFAVSATGAMAATEDTWTPPGWAASSGSTSFSDPNTHLTVTCASNTASGMSIGSGPDIPALAMKPPVFKSCTDSAGGTDTVTVNKTGWKIAFVSDSADPGCPTGTGNDEAGGSDCVVITVPQNAATINVGGIPGCVLTVQPDGPATAGATVSDPGGKTKDTFTLDGGSSDQLTYSATPTTCLGITGGTAGFSGVYTMSAPNGGILLDGS